MSARGRGWGRAGGVPANSYIGCWTMNQVVGHPINVANGRQGMLLRDELDSSVAWANPGYLTVGSGSGEVGRYPVLLNREFSFDIGSDSVVFATVVRRPAPTVNNNIAGCANTTSRYGFYLQERTGTNKLRPYITTDAGNFPGMPDSRAVVCDNADHSVLLAIDGPTKSVYLFIDGVLDTAAQTFYSGGGAVSSNLALGALQDTGTPATPVGGRFGGTQVMVFRGKGLPLNLAEIAAKFHAEPGRALDQQEVDDAGYSRIALAVAGQSNEQGSGSRVTTVGRVGAPLTDPVAPFGQSSAMSMWPGLSEQLGQSRRWLIMHNTARGSSSLANHWLGRIVAWGGSQRTAFGQYLLASGRIYKATTVPTSTNGVTGATEPTWPTSGTVVDGQVTWTFVRNATVADTVGKIMSSSDDLYDPNGYVANITTRLQRLPLAVAERRVYLAFGQEDSTRNTSRSDYATAVINFTQHMTSLGFTVHLGMSFFGSGIDTQYTENLIPGLEDAIAVLSGDALVRRGVNMRTEFGALTVSPPLGSYGLKADGLHVTDETYAAAIPMIAQALL